MRCHKCKRMSLVNFQVGDVEYCGQCSVNLIAKYKKSWEKLGEYIAHCGPNIEKAYHNLNEELK